MGKKFTEEFNPWPAFVDMFASVIMVVLMFMLVLVVNVAFYAQFKYKVSYTGTVPVDHVLTEEEITGTDLYKKTQTIIETKEEETKEILQDEEKEFVTAGIDLRTSDQNTTRQDNVIHLDWMVITYLNNEIILDPPTITEVEGFIKKAKEELPNHYISIFTSEPKEQTSATIARQIGLSRALNVRNLIRGLGYPRNEVIVKLTEKIPSEKTVEHTAGYVVIIVNQKR